MAGQETLIYIEENDKNEAGINARHFAKEDIQNRAYYNTLGAQLIKKFLASENVDTTNTYNIHSIKKVLEELDISDIMLKNIHLEVRIVFNENFIFIPKSHFKYEILPDIYLVLLMSNDKKYVKFLGFFEPKLINKKNQNDEYYFIEKEKLTPASNLKEYIKNFKGNTDQSLSNDEIDTSDMLILSMIDHDITEVDKKELLKNLVKSAKLRDRFIEFENFETLSYRAEHSPEVKKSEPDSGYPSIEIAAAATAEALEELDFAGSANTQDLPNENAIINGFNNLERNIPDLTPEFNLSEASSSSVDDMLNELDDFSDLSDMTVDEIMNKETTKSKSSIIKNSIEETSTEDLQSENIEDSNPQEIIQNEDIETLTNEDLESFTMDFNNLSQTDEYNTEEPRTTKGIIEQKNTPETLDFDEIMPFETQTAETSSNTVKTEISKNETIDFSDLENISESLQDNKIIKTDTTPSETMDFDDITTNTNLTETNSAEIEQKFTNIDNQTISANKLEGFESLSSSSDETSIDIGEIEADTESNNLTLQENKLEDFESLSSSSDETSMNTPLTDTNTVPNTDTNILKQSSENLSEEPELLFEEPLQELSFDDTELSLDEPLLEISEDLDETPSPEAPSPKSESIQSNETSPLEDFNNLIQEDEKTHKIEKTNEPIQNAKQEEQPDILPEDIELDRMLADENLTTANDSPVEPLSEELETDILNIEDQSIENNTSNQELLTEVKSGTEDLTDFSALEKQSETLSAQSDTIESIQTEDTITDLNLNADEIEKSTVTDDIAGVEEFNEPKNNTDLSTDELISQIDDLLSTTGSAETFSNTETQSMNSSTLKEESSNEKDDKLGVLFNTQNYDMDNNSNNFDYETEIDNSQEEIPSGNTIQEKGKQAILAAAVVAILAIVGGAGFFLLKNKNSTDILAQNPIESDGTNISNPSENQTEGDNTNLMTNAPDINTPTSAQKTPDTAPAQPSKPKPQQAQQAKAKPSTSPAQPSKNTPLPYVTVRSLAWEVPDYLSYSDKVKKYLQTAGKSIRLTLSSDLLLATEYAYSNQVKVEIKLKNDGTVQDAQITKSSGSTQINDIVLRTVKDTLKVVKPAPGEIPTPNFKLGLIINL